MKQLIISITLLISIVFLDRLYAQEKELIITYRYTTLHLESVWDKSFEVISHKDYSLSTLKTVNKIDHRPTISGVDEAEVERMRLQNEIPDITTFKDFKKKYLICQESINHKYFYIEEPLNQIKWKLTGNSKTILKYNCQEATATFRGRDYIAFFTTELPFKAAPFKFDGLPGVLLQIQTRDKQINIIVTSLKVQSLTEVLTNPFKTKNTMSWEDYVTFYKKKYEEKNNRYREEILANNKRAIKMGIDKSLLATNVSNVPDPRLEIIVPENDLGYIEKQMRKARENN